MASRGSLLLCCGLSPGETPSSPSLSISPAVVLLDFEAAKGELGWLTHPYGKGVSKPLVPGRGVGIGMLVPWRDAEMGLREDGAWLRSSSSARLQILGLLPMLG
jgi:hypothetical protein